MSKISELINFIDANDGRVEIVHNKGYWNVEVELEDDSNYAATSEKSLKKAIKKAHTILMTEPDYGYDKEADSNG